LELGRYFVWKSSVDEVCLRWIESSFQLYIKSPRVMDYNNNQPILVILTDY
jgi:hypothetical protein